MSSYLAFNKPPLHFVGLELVFVVAAVLTARHAFTSGRVARYQWLSVFFYGVFMELIAFNFLDNYQHGQFTVQLYHRKLPFYVMCVYPVFMYTGLKVVERWRLPVVVEALLAGFAMCLIDVPFDIAGIDARWWVWSDGDPKLAVRWLGVPVTSYYWYLTFGAVLALLSRALRGVIERRGLAVQLVLSVVTGAGIIVGGTLAFLPFHGLHALGLRQDAIVAGHLAGCALLALGVSRRALGPSLRALTVVPILVLGWCALVVVSLPEVPLRATKLTAVAAAALGALWLAFPPRKSPIAVEEKT